MEMQSNGDDISTKTPSRKESAFAGKEPDMMSKVSPMRLYVAHCILNLKKSLGTTSIKRLQPPSVLNNDGEEKKREAGGCSCSSYLTCPTLPTPFSEEKSDTDLDEKEGYHILIKSMKLFESYPVNERIDIQQFSNQCGTSYHMTLCILTILHYLGFTSIISNTIVKKSVGISSSHIQELIRCWKSPILPSVLEQGNVANSSHLNGQKGVTFVTQSPFPYSVNPSHYECPYYPEESLEITDNRVNWDHIPTRQGSVDQLGCDLFCDKACFSTIPIFCTSERMAEIMEKYCQLFLKELAEQQQFSLYAFLSKTIQIHFLYIPDRLCCLRLIVFVFHYLNLIQIQNRATVDSLTLEPSDILQSTPLLINLLSAKNEVQSKPISAKETMLVMMRELIQLPIVTPNSVKNVLNKHFPISNAPPIEDLRESMENHFKSILQSYKQCLIEKENAISM